MSLNQTSHLLAAYISKLKSHDWHFEFADDSKAWRSGKQSLKILHAAQASLDPSGEIWDTHCPIEHRINQPPKG